LRFSSYIKLTINHDKLRLIMTKAGKLI